MNRKSWWPKVKYHPMSLPPTLLKSCAIVDQHADLSHALGLLCVRRERPRHRRAAE